MGLVREPLGVDFYVESKPLTEEEREMISKHIREYKAKLPKRKTRIGLKEKEMPIKNKKE